MSHHASRVVATESDARYLRRSAAAEYLISRYGFGTAKTLAKGVVTGDTPRFYKAGKIVLYQLADLDAWASSKISERSFSSSTDYAAA